MNTSLIAINWTPVAPFLCLSLLGFLLVIIGMVFPKVYRETLGTLTLIGLAVTFFWALQNWGSPTPAFAGMIVGDKFSTAFNCIFIIGAAFTVLLSLNLTEDRYLNYADFFAIVVFATAGMLLMAAGTHLLTIFLGLETLSIALYVLAGFRRENVFSLESAFKYFLLGAFASGFLLYGIALIYGATGTASISEIHEFIRQQGLTSSMMLPIGTLLVFVGFGFKIAVFPFHMWAPDVYQGAPTPVSAFMATGSKAAGFAALLRVAFSMNIGEIVGWENVLWVIIVVTMTLGNIIALRQSNIKRMLAYSSIAHAGYIMVGFLAHSDMGESGMLFYLLSYTFMNIGAFGVISYLSTGKHEFVTFDDFKGLAYKRPFAAVVMAVFMFSLAGIPPTAGFISKFYIFSAAVKAGYVWLVIIAVINSMISLYYYLGVLVRMFMTTQEEEWPEVAPQQPAVALALALSALAVLGLGIFPSRWFSVFLELTRSFIG
ncbi:MAG: NADH-quinone oxidoreductase subunit N [Calditrichaeota bacterium]|nr:MAG: NADH-quinone oxidoreductase subunit N [Calditrichota bacterium]